MEIKFEGAYTEEELINMVKAFLRKTRTGINIDLWVIFVVSGAVLIISSLWDLYRYGGFGVTDLVVGSVLLIIGLATRRYIEAALTVDFRLREYLEGVITGETIECSARFRSGIYKWGFFTSYVDLGDSIVLMKKKPARTPNS